MAGEMKTLAKTPIGQAIAKGQLEELRRLIAQGADIRADDRKGNTYLHYVCTMYRPYIVNVLLASGIDIDARNIHGNTALHVTALNHEPCHVIDLIAYGASIDVKNENGKTAKDLAVNNKIWLDLFGNEPGLRKAIETHDKESISRLLHSWSACHGGKNCRQLAAANKRHDVVFTIDKVKYSLLAIFSVLECNYEALDFAVGRESECDVNYMQLRQGSHPHHILQHAVRMNNFRLVSTLLAAGADVNSKVYVKEYFRGPCFFEVIRFDGKLDQRITDAVMSADTIDVDSVDERGRSALIYALDRSQGDVDVAFVERLLRKNINVAIRDRSGCTGRDVARLLHRRDIVEAIDKHVTGLIRRDGEAAVRQLLLDGYEDVYLVKDPSDTWICASGTEDDGQCVELVERLSELKTTSEHLQQLLINGDQDHLQYVWARLTDRDTAACMRDKNGRNMLLNSILYGHDQICLWLLQQPSASILAQSTDNLQRTAFHYVQAALETSPIRQEIESLLTSLGCDSKRLDAEGVSAEDILLRHPHFISEERELFYPIEKLIACLRQYDTIMSLVKNKFKRERHLREVLVTCKYSLRDMKMAMQEARQDAGTRITSSTPPPPPANEEAGERDANFIDEEEEEDVIQAAVARGRHDMARILLLWEAGAASARVSDGDARRKDARVDDESDFRETEEDRYLASFLQTIPLPENYLD